MKINRNNKNKILSKKQAEFYDQMRSGNEGTATNRLWRKIRYAFRDPLRNRTEKMLKNDIDVFIGDLKGKNALEMGAGPGGSLTFKKIKYANSYIATDISFESVKAFRLKSQQKQMENVFCVVMDALNPCFKTEQFDVIVALGMVHHLNDTERMGNMIYELLNKQGYYVTCDPLNTEPFIRMGRILSAYLRPNIELEFPFVEKDVSNMINLFQKYESMYYYSLTKFLLPLYVIGIMRNKQLLRLSTLLAYLERKLSGKYKFFRIISWILVLKGSKEASIC